jgi:hypothetical protein
VYVSVCFCVFLCVYPCAFVRYPSGGGVVAVGGITVAMVDVPSNWEVGVGPDGPWTTRPAQIGKGESERVS